MYWLLIAVLAADLGSIRQEQNLERRSEMALEYADSSLSAARAAYSSGDLEKTKAAIGEMQESVDLAYESLTETGKDARRKPKFFKRAELTTRELLRRLEGFRESMSYQDRPLLEAAWDRVNEVHDALLTRIMGKKPKK